jgi:hypothetical protein
MHLSYNKTFEADPDRKVSGVLKDSPSALWTLQMSHQTKKCPDPSGKRKFFMDNFCMHHTLAVQVSVMSDDKIKITGTCLSTEHNQQENAIGVKKAIKLLGDKLLQPSLQTHILLDNAERNNSSHKISSP